MTSKIVPLTVEHCTKSLEFFVKMNGAKSVLQYRRLSNGVLDLYHTEVPPIFQGKGVAKMLCQAAFSYAREQNLRILPTCSYVAKYAKQMASPEEKTIVICREKMKRL
ncbi:unnamed protein product [Toxocara canis]|nr:unnamed protein product [Toxocara canis]